MIRGSTDPHLDGHLSEAIPRAKDDLDLLEPAAQTGRVIQGGNHHDQPSETGISTR